MKPNDIISELQMDKTARLLYEALEQLGWTTANASVMVARIARLELGLPAEDQFLVLITWLGQCKLAHKLRQEQYPKASSGWLRVPDLLALFQVGDQEQAVAIEVKTQKGKKLSWRPDFMAQLRSYGTAFNVPVLLACYWRDLKLWTLNDLNSFTLAETNFHLRYDTALKQNLLGVLAGDFFVTLKHGVGVHFEFGKIEVKTTDADGNEEEWILKLKAIYFTTANGERVKKVDQGIWSLLLSFPLEEQHVDNGDNVTLSYVVPDEAGMMLAQQGLSLFVRDGKTRWNELLDRDQLKPGASLVREGAEKGIGSVVQYIIEQIPGDVPGWLKLPPRFHGKGGNEQAGH